ncbi:MAG: hypothetical protein ACI97N_000643 [Cognaticolwellia sp.]|jgi:hypothetical protein|tara:strand:+ start:750 stop:1964 length:1215 start_codon:yes stop_codon:yes gene_type:complete
MKRKLLFILSMMITNFMMAQKSALLTDFRFIVNDTQEFPNFFENEDLTTDVLNIGLELIKEKLLVDDIKTHQLREIEYSFTPPFRDNLNNIDRNKHDYFIAITSSAGMHTSAKGFKTYVVYAKVRIENENGDTLFLNKKRANFNLRYEEGVLYNEAVIDKSDFKNFYTKLLKKTFLEEPDGLQDTFLKPTIVVYNGFMNRAETTIFVQNKRAFSKELLIKDTLEILPFFKVKSYPISRNGTIRVQDFVDILRFRKEFILKDKKQKTRLKIISTYEEATDYETKVRYIKSAKLEIKSRKNNSVLEFYPNENTSWVYTLEWTVSETESYQLLANAYTNYVEILSPRGLIGIIQLPSSGNKLLDVEDKEFVAYYKSGLTKTTKTDLDYLFAFFLMANEFMAEVDTLK